MFGMVCFLSWFAAVAILCVIVFGGVPWSGFVVWRGAYFFAPWRGVVLGLGGVCVSGLGVVWFLVLA
jgi:hypothetical protein